MRLLHIFNNDQEAHLFSQLLQKKGVDHQLEIKLNTDWGSVDYGTLTCQIWIVNEDDLKKAHEELQSYLEDPSSFSPSVTAGLTEPPPPNKPPKPFIRPIPMTPRTEPVGILSFYLILMCTLLLFISSATEPTIDETPPPYLPSIPLFSSPLKKAFFFDYPYTYELTDKLVKDYGLVFYPNKLPPSGKALAKEIDETPYWKGIYPKIVAYLRGETFSFNEPLFEKLKEGEVWRLLSPVFFHNDILHLFFNMMWLLVLGTQIERKLKLPRYIAFIVLTGVITNLAQYIMTGANFLGFSGVLTAMITFVWFRRQRVPWEGYQLLPSTMLFITVFILGIAVFQLISFIFEVLRDQSIAPPIANTAHLVGGLLGYLLARIPLFARKNK